MSSFSSLSNYMAMASFNPTFLRKMNYETPTDPNNTGFMAFTGGKKLFEMCALYPWMVEMFQAHMEAYADMRLDWTQIYDTEQLLVGFDFDKEAKNILFVDIGGGKGIDVNRLLKKHPDIPMRRIVLQELPEVMAIASATASEKVICQPYDFFKEQPITGECQRQCHLNLLEAPQIDMTLYHRSSCILSACGSSRLGRHRRASHLEAGQQSHDEWIL